MGALVKQEFLQSLTVQSADEVKIDLLSGLQSQAIYATHNPSITNKTYRMERRKKNLQCSLCEDYP